MKIYARGCTTQAQCGNAMTTIMKACEQANAAGADAVCEVHCCSGDLCNAGERERDGDGDGDGDGESK